MSNTKDKSSSTFRRLFSRFSTAFFYFTRANRSGMIAQNWCCGERDGGKLVAADLAESLLASQGQP